MSITHIVLFQFKEGVSAEVVDDVCGVIFEASSPLIPEKFF